jgi:OTU-like cysteine protease
VSDQQTTFSNLGAMRRHVNHVSLLRALLFLGALCGALCSSHSGGSSTTTTSSTGVSTLPRSHTLHRSDNSYEVLPPWNPSSKIDSMGFLQGLYIRTPGDWEQEVRLKTSQSLDQPCRIRQVPGDGNCLFHSLSLCLCHAVNGTHWNLTPSSSSSSRLSMSDDSTAEVSEQLPALDDLYEHSRWLRAQAVACLRDARRRLVLQGRESLRAAALVQAAAQQYGLSADEYCAAMSQESVWGGGPEVVALCNVLQRPIHVYELATMSTATDEASDSESSVAPRLFASFKGAGGSNAFLLRRMACFGSPKFDRQEALHILSADSRFPDIRPGQQLPAGNHFLAVFPVPEDDDDDDGGEHGVDPANRHGRKRIRGGDCTTRTRNDDGTTTSADSSILRRLAMNCIEWWRDSIQHYW